MEALFSYGTLQQTQVQLDTFGRLLNGQADALVGYRVGLVKITDPDVLKSSGKEHHPILIYTADEADQVEGTVFAISEQELLRADSYEVDDYVRQKAVLKSGESCWIYAASEKAHILDAVTIE
ncbi:UDP-N-acetylmuramate--alanine ligase [Pseudoalteromonas rubra]|uniref:UDP-N-acetylmuramate--alanine ligase n=1 Tax=Pseudoalteromonas rubra TaxID=43658 RepID=A0A5S3WH82_9GAMM|nr:gamma-glutamylcyclotransferase family protein [Pseudoalteromonas rubra]TMP26114.1 UDP-N-acetylmuramate--alanine ligase [Pseudoalteromonas rubra]TMP29751.1 UDP-N-acetylmuramate--alanine ligase [Pseudoalteromonas rubra]